MKIARHGVAMLSRTVFIESVGRYERIFKKNAPSRFAQFTERVPMVKGRVDEKASTATGYAWLVWEKVHLGKGCELVWIDAGRCSLSIYLVIFLLFFWIVPFSVFEFAKKKPSNSGVRTDVEGHTSFALGPAFPT